MISENEARAADNAVLQEEPGPSRPPVYTTEGDVSPLEVMEAFVEGWVQALDHEDRKSLAMLLCFVLVKELSFTETNAAALTRKLFVAGTLILSQMGVHSQKAIKDVTRELVFCGQMKSSTRRQLRTLELMLL